MPIISFSVVLIVMIIILLVSFVLFRRDKKELLNQPVVIKRATKSLDTCSIEEIVERIATEKLDEKELLKIVALVAQNHKFPSKKSGKDNTVHLRFISEFCLNKNVDGATIVKMSNTLKMVNPAYKNDIELAERNAVKLRDEKNNKG